MEFDTKTPTYQTSDPTSFAYISARERWPTILTGAIDDVHRTVAESQMSEEEQKEGKTIIENLARLKYELQHNRALSPLPDDGETDVEGYNAELQARDNPTWHNVEWLFAECYLYRRVSTLFARSNSWKSYDIFARQKMSTFRSSRPAVLELAARYKDMAEQIEKDSALVKSEDRAEIEAAEKVLFTEMMEICLWGNATDLSLLTSLSYEDIQKLQGSNARKESEKNIVVNNLPTAFGILRDAKNAGKSQRRVDLVLDNAGFELFVDLILAGYLLTTELATEVILHPKSIPWFVSDVIPKDFADLANTLANPQAFYSVPDNKNSGKAPEPLTQEELTNTKFLSDSWSHFHSEGKLILRPNRFWTHAGSFWRMPATCPELFEDLKQSELVIFKGDLNYRKLTGDAAWDPTTSFSTTIGPMGPGSGVRTLALRTCKADVVVGLPAGRDEELRETEGGGGNSGARKWAWSGKWAVVQFCDGRA